MNKTNFLFTLLILLLASCTSKFDKENIRLEKENNTQFLKAIQQKDYEQAIHYLSEEALSGERTPAEFIDGLKQLEDSFGTISSFELLQQQSHKATKTGQTDVHTRKYVYLLNCAKAGNKLQFDLVFNVAPEDIQVNKERKIDFVAIDVYEEKN